MMQQVWSVSSLIRYIKRGIDNDPNLNQLLVKGEISNLTKHRSGHYYFTLKDDTGRMSCVMFANFARYVHFDLKEGTRVIAQCRVSVYEAGGSVQMYVNALQPDGIGDLYLQFEQLKKKLNAEGYFDSAHKKQLPLYPMDIALITAKEGAARKDVMITLKRRWPLASLTFYPCLVQGNEAPRQLIATLLKADQQHHDVILLVRGGGSIEDLWAFNHEELAKCIYHMNTVIVSGVGHETDTTLVDYVSDARAATPTAAAELISPDIKEVKMSLVQKKRYLMQLITRLTDKHQAQLAKIHLHPYIRNPLMITESSMLSLDMKKNALEKIAYKKLEQLNLVAQKKTEMQHLMQHNIINQQAFLDYKRHHLKPLMDQFQKRYEKDIQKKISLLDAYSPLKIMMRGYTITKKENQFIRNCDDIQIKDEITTRLNDGLIISKVTGKEKFHE